MIKRLLTCCKEQKRYQKNVNIRHDEEMFFMHSNMNIILLEASEKRCIKDHIVTYFIIKKSCMPFTKYSKNNDSYELLRNA